MKGKASGTRNNLGLLSGSVEDCSKHTQSQQHCHCSHHSFTVGGPRKKGSTRRASPRIFNKIHWHTEKGVASHPNEIHWRSNAQRLVPTPEDWFPYSQSLVPVPWPRLLTILQDGLQVQEGEETEEGRLC